jgi:hypothetical protein
MTRMPAGIAALVLLGASLAAAQLVTSEDIEQLKTGREEFEARYVVCHPVERCLSRNKAPEDWTRTVKRMSLLVEGGIAKKDVNPIVAYLSVRCPAK